MKKNILNENEFKNKILEIYEEEKMIILNEKWNRLSSIDKRFSIEFLKVVYPERSKLINESKWYNTLGDIAGIFDPTGAIDFVNGISYWRQGDHLFAMLSWISVFPYLGDAIAKPVIGVFKAGGIVGKEFKMAMMAKDALKMGQAAKSSGPLKTFLMRSPEWGAQLLKTLKGTVGKIPFVNKIIPIVEDYVKLFKDASVGVKTAGTGAKGAEGVFKGFRNFKGVKNNWFKYMTSNAPLWEKLNAGSFRIFGGNPATRSLMRRSKWYLGFLDTVGLANTTVGPEELESKVPDLESKLEKYNRSSEGIRNMEEDIANSEQQIKTTEAPPPPPAQEPKSDKQFDVMSLLFGNII